MCFLPLRVRFALYEVTLSIRETLDALRARGELALIPYLTGGYPSMSAFSQHLQATAASGADLIEIGIPFCDPIADGPTIQHSSQVALAQGASLPAIFESIRAASIEQPLIFMSYLNPLLAYGQQRVLEHMAAARVRGLIIADLPVEESDPWLAIARDQGVDLIFLAAPTSTDARLREIARRASGFIYAVSRTGTTGTQAALSSDLGQFLGRIRAVTDAPIAVGFGISSPQQVASLRGQADGVVIGSKLVDTIRNAGDLAGEIRQLKAACRA